MAETKFKRPRPQRLADFRFFPRVSTPAHAILSIQQHRETPNSTNCLVSSSRVGSCRHGRRDGCSDAGGHCSSGGTSGSEGASPRPLVFLSGIDQFDELLDGGARTRCHLCAGRPACGLLWAGAILHSMHPEFFCILHSSHSCIPKCQRYILHSHSTHSAFLSSAPHVFCIPAF